MQNSGELVMVIGGGTKAFSKIQPFLGSGATIWVISKDFSEDIVRLGEARQVALLKTDIRDAKAFVDSLNPKPDVLFAVTGDKELNFELVKAATAYGAKTQL